MINRMIMGWFGLGFIVGCGAPASEDEAQRPAELPSDTACTVSKGDVCGEPVDIELGRWRWHAVEGTQCLDGTETGFGVRLGEEAEKVLIYLEGGGACYNAWSCKNIYTDHFGAEDFGDGKQIGIFNRNDPANPFQGWTHVYIPYCSGDMHAGSVRFGEKAAGRAHWGYQNISLYLKRLVPTLHDAERVVLAGSSAGGFGVTYNWHQFQQAFDSVVLDVINDSAPFLSDSFLDACFADNLANAWNLANVLGAACPGCFASSMSMSEQLKTIRRMQPGGRYALLTSGEDFVIRTHYAFANDDCANWDAVDAMTYDAERFRAGLDDYQQRLGVADEAYIYQGPGMGHVLLFENFSAGLATEQGGIALHQWLQSFVDGAPLRSVMGPVQASP